MPRRFQFSVKGLLAQAALVALGCMCLRASAHQRWAWQTACLIVGTAAAWGSAWGVLRGKPLLFALSVAAAMLPLAWLIALHAI